MYFYQKEEYKEMKNRLKDEYAVCYNKAEAYIHASNYFGFEHEENCMMQLLDDFLSAQAEGKPVVKITGADLRLFCKEIIKAESQRIINFKLYMITQISGAVFLIAFMIFAEIFHTRKAFIPENLHKPHFGGLQLVCTIMFILYFVLKKAISVAFFNHVKISRLFSTLSYLIFLCSAYTISMSVDKYINLHILVPFPILLPITIISLSIFVAAIIINKKNYIKPVFQENDITDNIDTVTCPECGQEHDCDYPRCPHCKYRYNHDHSYN